MRTWFTGNAMLAILVAVLSFVVLACEENMSGGGTPPPKPSPSPAAGTAKATLGPNTSGTLHIENDGDFSVTVAVQRGTPATNSVRRLVTATDTSTATRFVVLTGTVDVAGRAATFTITGVRRDGVALTGDELKKYAGCAVTATIDADFQKEAFEAVAECLSSAGDVDVSPTQVTVVVVPPDARPIDRLTGEWIAVAGYFGDATGYRWVFSDDGMRVVTYLPWAEWVWVFDIELNWTAITDWTITEWDECRDNWDDPPSDDVIDKGRCRGLGTDDLASYARSFKDSLPIYYSVSDDGLSLTAENQHGYAEFAKR